MPTFAMSPDLLRWNDDRLDDLRDDLRELRTDVRGGFRDLGAQLDSLAAAGHAKPAVDPATVVSAATESSGRNWTQIAIAALGVIGSVLAAIAGKV